MSLSQSLQSLHTFGLTDIEEVILKIHKIKPNVIGYRYYASCICLTLSRGLDKRECQNWSFPHNMSIITQPNPLFSVILSNHNIGFECQIKSLEHEQCPLSRAMQFPTYKYICHRRLSTNRVKHIWTLFKGMFHCWI